MIAFVLVCTGRYTEFFDNFYTNFRILYPFSPLFVLTDNLSFFLDYQCVTLKIDHEPWPGIVMHKYRNLLKFNDLWKNYDFVVLLQSNMIFLKKLPIVDAPIMYCYHPYYDKQDYICGGLVGGRPDDLMQMATAVQRWLDNHPDAIWHDETALNWYWRTLRPDAKILPSSTMYAEERSDLMTDDSCILLTDKSKHFGSGDKRQWTQ